MKSDFVILWEAHRGGGGKELPESTPASFEYGWRLGGIPEADVNSTRDGVLMSLHDGTLDRTARSLKPEWRGKPISELDSAEVRSVDIGSEMWPNQRVPSIDELIARLRDDPDKERDHHRLQVRSAAAARGSDPCRRRGPPGHACDHR